MKHVYISGIGFNGRKKRDTASSFSVSRKLFRFAGLVSYAAVAAVSDSVFPDGIDRNTIGTVFGASITDNDSFWELKGKRHISPSYFIGHLQASMAQCCTGLELRGVSVVLETGNPLEYSQLLLSLGRADYIVSSSSQSVCDELKEVLADRGLADTDIEEGACSLVLSSVRTDNCYAELCGTVSEPLKHCSLWKSDNPAEDMLSIKKALDRALALGGLPDMVFASGNGSSFDDMELFALGEAVGDVCIVQPKKEWGETLGCAFMLNVAEAASVLKQDSSLEYVWATGLDGMGNYHVAVLKR